jgi:hypothetical protein
MGKGGGPRRKTVRSLSIEKKLLDAPLPLLLLSFAVLAVLLDGLMFCTRAATAA